jgi:hypothetical protein
LKSNFGKNECQFGVFFSLFFNINNLHMIGGGGSMASFNQAIKDNKNLLKKRKKFDKDKYGFKKDNEGISNETRENLRKHREYKEKRDARLTRIFIWIIVVGGIVVLVTL